MRELTPARRCAISGLRRALGNIPLVCGELLAGLILAEVGLRILGITYPVFDAYDATRGVALKPGKQGWYYGEGGAYVKINSLGYRDVEHTREKPPGVFRIAVLGDSMTEARQVSIADTFCKQLEKRLSGRPEFGNLKVEVLNFGIGGYGTDQELLTLRLHVLDFSPDLVMLTFGPGNDVSGNFKQLLSQVKSGGLSAGYGGPLRRPNLYKPFYQLRDGKLIVDNSFRNFGLDYFYGRFLLEAIHYSRCLELINQARRAIVVRKGHHVPRQAYNIALVDKGLVEPKDEVWKEAWRITDALIIAMNEEVLRARARFVLVTLTTPIQVDPDVAKREETQRALGASDLFYTERRLRQLGKRFGFPVITLAEEVQAAAVQRHIYFHGFANTGFGTGHFNERGHEIVADILTRELAPFLPESRHGKAPEAGDLLPSNSISRGSPSGSPGLKQ
jgi:lysophospholipase L1-like esterase